MPCHRVSNLRSAALFLRKLQVRPCELAKKNLHEFANYDPRPFHRATDHRVDQRPHVDRMNFAPY